MKIVKILTVTVKWIGFILAVLLAAAIGLFAIFTKIIVGMAHKIR